MSCQEVARRLWDYLDGRLASEEASQVRVHMAACLCCFRYRRFQQRLFRRVADLRRAPSPGSAEAQRRVLLALLAAGWDPRGDPGVGRHR